MKTIHPIRYFAVVLFLSMLTIAATAQRSTRQDRRTGSERNTVRTETSQRSRSNTKARPSSDNSTQNSTRQTREKYVRNDSRPSHQPKKSDHNYKKEKHNQGQYQKPQSGYNHSPAYVNNRPSHPVHYSARVHQAPNRHAYYSHLPTKRVSRFHYNGYDYYHSNNHFYRYYPHQGYQIVEVPFTRVRYLPARYQVRVYNGYSYPYYNGYFFLPAEYGYVMVPAPPRPQRAFNIVLNF